MLVSSRTKNTSRIFPIMVFTFIVLNVAMFVMSLLNGILGRIRKDSDNVLQAEGIPIECEDIDLLKHVDLRRLVDGEAG